MSYRQSGIEYREANFAYNQSNATVSVATIAATANLILTARYTYRPAEKPGSVNYRWHLPYNNPGFVYNERDNSAPDHRLLKTYNQPNVSYRQASDVGVSFKVVAFPGSIPIATTVGGTGSVPATIVAGVIGCTAQVADHTGPLIINLDMDYIEIAVHVPTLVALPAATISSIVKPANIDIDAAVHGHVLIITTTVNPGTIGVAAALPAPSVSANFAYTQQIPVKTIATLPTVPLFARLTLHVFNRTPTVGRPQDTTPAAYALRRHYVPLPQGENVFIINNAIVQTFLPADTATVTRWIYGAHVPPTDLTLTEVSLLQAAGYQFDVGPE